jgi:hypothetical protein
MKGGRSMRQFREYLCIGCGKEKIKESRFEVETTIHAEADRLPEDNHDYIDYDVKNGKLLKNRFQSLWQNISPGEEKRYTIDKIRIGGLCDNCANRKDVNKFMEEHGLQFEFEEIK